MFFKRLSRGRSNSYVDEGYDPTSPTKEARYDSDRYDPHPPPAQHNLPPGTAPGVGRRLSSAPKPLTKPLDKEYAVESPDDMYPRARGPQDAYAPPTHGSPISPVTNGHTNGFGAKPGYITDPLGGLSGKSEPMPDLLTRAFNEAIRPYTDQISQLEAQVAELQGWVETLERERSEIHSWIDKRGLRPDVPPSIAKQMDTSHDAASTLNAQLDRKITIVNFDLHRLQDDLNDSISASHFAAAMSKFLPDIARLAALPRGPRFAFDLILKLGGNLNSHGGLESSEDPADLRARKDFYTLLDNEMVSIVRRRFDDEGADWGVQREIKRIEKTASYLRNYGVEPYFPGTLEVMKRGEIGASGYAGNGAGVNGAGVNGAGVNGAGVNGAGVNGGAVGGATPPRYSQS